MYIYKFQCEVANDLLVSWKEMGYLAAVSIAVSFIITLLMRFIAKVFIWLMVISKLFVYNSLSNLIISERTKSVCISVKRALVK